MTLRSFPSARRAALASCVAAAALALTSCGGGGDAPPGPAPAAPSSLSIAYGARSLGFTWPVSEGATSYRLLEDARNDGNFAEVATNLAGTRFHYDPGPLYERVNARYAVQACNGQRCSAPSAAAAADVNKAVGYFKASNPGAGDEFGSRVVLSADGRTMAVGTRLQDSVASNSGAVYVFVRGESGWVQQAFLKAANAGSSDEFGYALAISGDGSTIAVGARGEDSGQTGVYATQPPEDDSAFDAGAVYVFARSGGAWTQQAYIKASNAEARDSFGSKVALSASGDTLAVSAVSEDGDGTGIVHGAVTDNNLRPNSGAVYVFQRAAGAWTQQAYAKAWNAETGDFLGRSLALSGDGNVLAVSSTNEDSDFTGVRTAPFGDNNLATDSGAVYLYTRTGSTWSQQAHIKGHAAANIQAFGSGVALSGDGTTLVVGAHNEGSDLKGTFTTGPALDTAAHQSGAVYVFTHRAGSWTQQAFIKASNTAGGDHFGDAVAVSGDGDTLVVGAHWRSGTLSGIFAGTDFSDDAVADATGAAYVFRRTGGRWSQQAYLKASNNTGEFQFGTSVAVSADGRTTAVGAIYENGGAPGVQGDQANQSVGSAGAVYVY